LRQNPSLVDEPVGSDTFINAVLEPHRCYYRSIKDLFDGRLVGLAHITGGGIRENLNRILPVNVDAQIDLGLYQPPEVFKTIRDASNGTQDLMLRTFNLGVGLAAVCHPEAVDSVIEHLETSGEHSYVIGKIVTGSGKVTCHGALNW